MIIQTGMRTDIPAFYSEWFINRIKEGFVYTRNPYYPENVTKYNLSPDIVDLIGFCTKNPGPMISKLDYLKDYNQYWFVTITPYLKDIEPNVPDKNKIINDFKFLSNKIGINSVCWRYDPIFISNKYAIDYHLNAFAYICSQLSGYTNTCVISFIDLYQKVKRNFPNVREISLNEKLIIGERFAAIAKKYNIQIKACAEGQDLKQFGIDCSGCMTISAYEKVLNKKLKIPSKKTARKECACYLANDIGTYNSCGHLCKYCYANNNVNIVKYNMTQHNPNSPFLIGNSRPGDIIHETEQKSWIVK